MDYSVRFRVNKITGQVELFEVDHEGPQTLDDAEHNRRHECLAAEIGRLIQRDPRIIELSAGTLPEPEEAAEPACLPERQTPPEQEKNLE
jgi:hypothetical protein